jgi:hypothetical protein
VLLKGWNSFTSIGVDELDQLPATGMRAAGRAGVASGHPQPRRALGMRRRSPSLRLGALAFSRAASSSHEWREPRPGLRLAPTGPRVCGAGRGVERRRGAQVGETPAPFLGGFACEPTLWDRCRKSLWRKPFEEGRGVASRTFGGATPPCLSGDACRAEGPHTPSRLCSDGRRPGGQESGERS